MKQLLASLVFLGFVLAGALFARSNGRNTRIRKRHVSVFLAYALLASFVAGLAQKNLWPFSDWPLIAGEIPRRFEEFRLVALDSTGGEHFVDYRAWEPLSERELLAYLARVFPGRPAVEQDSVAAFLLRRIEAARTRAEAGGDVGYLDRILGPLTAPYFLMAPRRWSRPEDVPSSPFVGLRMFFDSWDLVDRAHGDTTVDRRVVYEYVAP